MKTKHSINFLVQSHDCVKNQKTRKPYFSDKTDTYVFLYVNLSVSLAQILAIRKNRPRHFRLENFLLFSIRNLRCADFINIPALVNGGCHA